MVSQVRNGPMLSEIMCFIFTVDGTCTKCHSFFFSRVEAESLRHLSAKYCPLVPPPRSTIAAAFSSDGRTLASTQ